MLNSTEAKTASTNHALRWIGLAIALAIPTLFTWLYFVLADNLPGGAQRTIFLFVKIAQFAFPAIWVWAVLREKAWRNAISARGAGLGAGAGVCIVAVGLFLYVFILRGTPLFNEASGLILEKLIDFGINRPWKYAALAIFYSLFHSLFEEYYWRWFVFGQLRRFVNFWPAALVAAAFFAGHHIIVLAAYFGAASPLTWLFSTAVAVGGLFWSWLYERSHSLVGPWLSHLLIDAGIFAVGYDIIRSSL
jgi:membrane protease YdiL (CAAX protease family)